MSEKQTQRRFEVVGEDIFAILERITSDQDLLKLIKYMDKDPLSHPDLTENEIDELLNKNILITPKILDTTIDLNNYIVILLNDYEVDRTNDEFKQVSIQFNVICPIEKWIINQKNLRPYMMMNRIDKLFNKKQLAGIGNLRFARAVPMELSPELSGYALVYVTYEFNY